MPSQQNESRHHSTRRITKCTAFKRWGKPEEIAGVALLLGTDAGSYLTGTTILIDGGVLANTL